ncbi:hypothetical protein [Halorubrum sp. DTA98]|uniref:hypothetical protein n=1 Tax=Halorubrum sp. DTA98 TaxID=3402163 RepID=UPI003AAFAB14
MHPVERYARAVVAHRRLLLAAVLIATAAQAQAYVHDALETAERSIRHRLGS